MNKSYWSCALALASVVALLPVGCKSVIVQTPLAVAAVEKSDQGKRLSVPEVTPIVMVKGDVASLAGLQRTAIFQSTPSRHGTLDPMTLALETTAMTSGKVPITPAIGIRDGRKELSDIERILRTSTDQRVELLLQIDQPALSLEPLVPCAPGALCLTSMLQVEQMQQLTCAPSGSLPSLPVLSVEARVVTSKDARVVAVARGAIVAPSDIQVQEFQEPTAPGTCRYLAFAKPDPLTDYRSCCQAILNAAPGKATAENTCPDLLECKAMKPSVAFQKLRALNAGNPTVEQCKFRYSEAEVIADEKSPQSKGEALWLLQDAVVHALLGGPVVPAAVAPTLVTAPAPSAAAAPAPVTPMPKTH